MFVSLKPVKIGSWVIVTAISEDLTCYSMRDGGDYKPLGLRFHSSFWVLHLQHHVLHLTRKKKRYLQYKNINFLPCGSLCAHLIQLFHREVIPAGLWSEGTATDHFEICSVIYLWLSCLKFFLLCQGLGLLKTVCELLLHPGLDHRKLLAELLGHYYVCIGKEQSNALIKHIQVDHFKHAVWSIIVI